MKEVRFNGNRLEMYYGIESTPITRHMTFNRFVLIDGQIGGDLDALDAHIMKVTRYIQKDEKELASKQLMNLRQCYYFIINEMNPTFYSFAALIKSINGKPFEDISDESIKRVITKLGKKGLTFEKVQDFLFDVKKKLMASLKSFFLNLMTARKKKNTSAS